MANESGSLTLSELLARYVQREANAQAQGETFHEVQGEVDLYDAGAQPVVDVRKGWEEAQFALRTAGQLGNARLPTFTEWPALLAAQDTFLALPMAAGHTPQLVRNLQPLLLGSLSLNAPGLIRPVPHAALSNWIQKNVGATPAEQLLAVGLLRLSRQFAEAEQLLAAKVPSGWDRVLLNERAALLWAKGEHTAAQALWQSDTTGSLPIRFNRGMAALFLNDRATAHAELTEALKHIPEASAWHHLARLYLTLATA